ncbi:MAG: hypothetical protein AB7K09_08860 [Planctomycetota bacterium]
MLDAPLATAEDTLLHKLDWYRRGGEVSDRQWQDALAILKVQRDALDREYLLRHARAERLDSLLDRGMAEAGLA